MYIPKKQVVYQILCLFRLSLTSSSSSSSFFYYFQLKLSDSVFKSNRILYTSLFISVNMTNETCHLRISVLSRASIYVATSVAVAVALVV